MHVLMENLTIKSNHLNIAWTKIAYGIPEQEMMSGVVCETEMGTIDVIFSSR